MDVEGRVVMVSHYSKGRSWGGGEGGESISGCPLAKGREGERGAGGHPPVIGKEGEGGHPPSGEDGAGVDGGCPLSGEKGAREAGGHPLARGKIRRV